MGKVITDIFPRLELIIGKQKKVSELNAQEAKHRFNYVFKNFISAIANKQHPLILFIDDFQWADTASLDILKSILLDKSIKYFMLIGTYRHKEVSANLPFDLFNRAVKKQSANYTRILLQNLDTQNINRLVKDALITDKGKMIINAL